MHPFKPGAINLGTIGAIVEPERQHAGGEGIEHDAEGGEDEIEEEDLDQERRRADELDESGNRPGEYRKGDAGKRQCKAENCGDDEAEEGCFDGYDRSPREDGQDFENIGPAPHVSAPAPA